MKPKIMNQLYLHRKMDQKLQGYTALLPLYLWHHILIRIVVVVLTKWDKLPLQVNCLRPLFAACS